MQLDSPQQPISIREFYYFQINQMVASLGHHKEQTNTHFIEGLYRFLGFHNPEVVVCQNPEIWVNAVLKEMNNSKSLHRLIDQQWNQLHFKQIEKLCTKHNFTEYAKIAAQYGVGPFKTIEQLIENKLQKQFNLSVSQLPSVINFTYRALAMLRVFYQNNFGLKLDFLQKQFSETNIFWCAIFQNKFIYCPLPLVLHLDENNWLHAENSAAIAWENFEIYAWRGVEVERQLILHPENITKETIIKETNAEKRRIIQEKLGSERFAHLLGLKVIDEDYDLQGNLQALYITKEPDAIVGDYLYFAKVSCPSTQRTYFLGVPPGLNNVWDAVAWTFGKTKESYRPIIET